MPYSHALDPAPLFHKVMHLTQGLAPVGVDSLKQLEHGCPRGLCSPSFCLWGQLGHRLFVFHSFPLDRKSPLVTEVKVTSGKLGKEDRKGASQEKKQFGIRDKEDKRGARLPPGKEACSTCSGPGGGAGEGIGGAAESGQSLQHDAPAPLRAALEKVLDLPRELLKAGHVCVSPSRTV